MGYLLLIMEEEDAFWTMVAVMEDLMPATYYTANIPGITLLQALLYIGFLIRYKSFNYVLILPHFHSFLQ